MELVLATGGAPVNGTAWLSAYGAAESSSPYDAHMDFRSWALDPDIPQTSNVRALQQIDAL